MSFLSLPHSVTPVGNFMKSPLVSWAKTFQDEEKKLLDYKCLCDGVFLYNVWLEIDPHPPYHGVNVSTDDAGTRIRNLDALLHNIKAFYEEVLGQLLLKKIPDILILAKHNEEYSSIEEMESMLLLILGCAVQCDKKEHFIEIIKSMDLEVQHKIVDYIQQITDNPEAVWTSEWSELNLVSPEEQENMYRMLVQHLRRLLRERDELSQKIINSALQSLSLSCGTPLSPISTNNIDKSHLIVELADVKAKLRKLQQEVEEKNEGITELKEELEISKDNLNKFRQENLELIQDARTAKTYRDEIDILKERVRKVDRLESEIQRYRDKINELDFYKSRVEELREDNRILVETKSMLEEQLEASRKRSEQVVELEADILKYCSQINELNIEKESDREKMQQLIEENAQLHIDRKASMEEVVQLQNELSRSCAHPSPLESHSLLEQLNTDAQTRALQLELENQRLRMLVESLNRSPSFEISNPEQMMEVEEYINNIDFNSWKNQLTLENIGVIKKEHKALKDKNNNLEKELSDLRSTVKKLSSFESQCQELEKTVAELQAKIKLHQAEVTKYEQLEQNINSLVTENQKLQRIVDTSQQRFKDLQQDLQAIESENQKLNNNVETLKLSVRKYHDLERETTNLESINHRLEQEIKGFDKENNRLRTAIESKDLHIEDYASRVSYLERENKQLLKEVDNLNQIVVRVRELERENKDLNQQTAVDKKSLEALRQDLVSEKIANQKLNNELHSLKSQVESNNPDREVPSHEHDNQQKYVYHVVPHIYNKNSSELSAADKFLCDKDSSLENPSDQTVDAVKQTECEQELKEADVANSKEQNSTSISSEMLMFPTDDKEVNLTLKEELYDLRVNHLELEKRKSVLEEDNFNLNSQVSALKDQNANQKNLLESLEQHLNSILSQNSDQQSELARLQVEITLISSQNKTLVSRNSMFQTQVSNLEDQLKKTEQQYSELEVRNKILVTDHESLQHLHEQLTDDYESLVKKHSSLKNYHKSLKAEHNSLKERLQSALFSQEEVMRLKEVLEDDDARTDARLLNTLRSEHIQVKEQLKSLRDTHDGVIQELKALKAVHKALKAENNDLKLKHTALRGELLECQNETSSLDIEISKLTNCCELLSQKNCNLEEEQQSLMSHVSVLLSQYHELLHQVISEHSQLCKEANNCHEKLQELHQQKVKLDQKIVEHCGKLQRSPKKKHFQSVGSLRMRRTRSASLRNSKYNDPLSSQSDNSTDSSLYCSLRRPSKSAMWGYKSRGDYTGMKDSCQEDHIPVRDVGFNIQKEESSAMSIPKSNTGARNEEPHHTVLENNMTLNFITNIASPDEPYKNRPLVKSASSQHVTAAENTFQSLLCPIQNDILEFSPIQNKDGPPSFVCSDTNKNMDSTESSKLSRSKIDKNNEQNSLSGKEKSLENAVWYEYGCV